MVEEFFAIELGKLVGDLVEEVAPLDNRVVEVLFADLSCLLEVRETDIEVEVGSEVIVLQ